MSTFATTDTTSCLIIFTTKLTIVHTVVFPMIDETAWITTFIPY
jgi:hypothetical protein